MHECNEGVGCKGFGNAQLHVMPQVWAVKARLIQLVAHK